MRYLKADTLSDCPPLSPSPGLLRFILYASALFHLWTIFIYLVFGSCLIDAMPLFQARVLIVKWLQLITIIIKLLFPDAAFPGSSLKKSITCVDARHTCLILSGRSRLCMDFATFSKLHKQVCLNEICKR